VPPDLISLLPKLKMTFGASRHEQAFRHLKSAGTKGGGAIKTNNNAPVANAAVSIVGTQDSAVTDSDGQFKIDSILTVSNTLQLLVQIDGTSNIVELGEIPTDKNTIQVALLFNVNLGTVILDEVSYLNEIIPVLDGAENDIQDATVRRLVPPDLCRLSTT
jgi:hypothetical protein